jgi:hypothetical protein
VDLQPYRRESSIPIEDGAGRRGRATLIDLNPRARTWFLLTLAWEGSPGSETYHLQSADPLHQQLRLEPTYVTGLVIGSDAGTEARCDLWSVQAREGVIAAKASSAAYSPLCDERVYLRDPAEGSRTAKEWAADMLRDHVWGGEKITDLVRDTFFKDAWLQTSQLSADGGEERRVLGAPGPARLDAASGDQLVAPAELGLAVVPERGGRLGVGRWYEVLDQPGIFVSAVTPGAISPDVLAGVAHPPNRIDPVEAGALVYLVAFDLHHFELGFEVGTEHPRVDWSDHLAPGVRVDAMPGPDGIGTIEPLVRTGMLSPAAQGRVAASFTGGFKRTHAAMRWGALAEQNHGSHYGFLVHGVILSELQPGLATAAVYDDGRVALKTWTRSDDRELSAVRFARQNGVSLIERDASSGRSEPGALVTEWGAGNWSGSEDKRLRTLRAGLCLQEYQERRFLVYGYFSTATPSAMATVFQGYGCRYAMHLDMNALEHTYLALYHRRDARLLIQHLIEGMSAVDKTIGSQHLPRFVAFPDNRDFFYLLRRAGS